MRLSNLKEPDKEWKKKTELKMSESKSNLTIICIVKGEERKGSRNNKKMANDKPNLIKSIQLVKFQQDEL